MNPLPHLPRSTAGIDDLVEAVVVSAGHLNMLLAHMELVAASDMACPDADPPLIVLGRLLRGTLAGLTDRFALTDLELATRIVNQATAVIQREVVIVDPVHLAETDDD